MSTIRTMAEIEAENEKLAKETVKYDRKKRYDSMSINVGYEIDADVAKEVLAAVSPDKLGVTASKYTIVSDKYSAAILGLDSDNNCVFTADLPKEVEVELPDRGRLDDTLEEFRKSAEKAKRIGAISTVLTGISIALVILAMGAIWIFL